MNRIVIFAHYDKFNIIEDYVVYFLKELKKVTNTIIFVSDSNIPDIELEKINNIITHSIIGNHGEYDFGSYKRGFKYVKDNGLLEQCEELVFVNDSCYAPLFSFEEIFTSMSNKNLDFWGNTINKTKQTNNIPHVQSYFIVFKRKVFNSTIFQNFILNITKQKSKFDIIKNYECGLTKLLDKSNFKWDIYCKYGNYQRTFKDLFFKEFIKTNRSPFLKRSIPQLKNRILVTNLEDFITNNTNYDYRLITQDLKNKTAKLSLSDYLIIVFKLLFKMPCVYLYTHVQMALHRRVEKNIVIKYLLKTMGEYKCSL